MPEERSKIIQSMTDAVATDPLSKVSRGERKALLGSTLISIAIAKGGLIPSEIPSLGIKVPPPQRLSLLYLLSGILTFYILAFWVYGRADLKRRRAVLAAASDESRQIVQQALARFNALPQPDPKDPEAQRQHMAELGSLSEATTLVNDITAFARIRIAFDVYLPIALGLIGLVLVLHETRAYPGGRVITWSLVVASLAAVLLYTAIQWAKITHWFGVKRHNYYYRRFMRISKRVQALPEGSPRRERLKKKVEPYLRKSLKGPWV
ncbi:MAG TPA: hypothetical protein VN999_11895 [Thermoanaerobaculia bacterium]|nr:hypothetical protein [Thermoanaerobaculia bacterium]